ncbi:MAG: menaquinone biosynthesis protein [Acidobacteria bacterium]|nr:menaquinone biosynthesis protein [Acidobacteriota bacterium]
MRPAPAEGKVRLGSVNYLNCRPLVHDLGGAGDPDFTLRFDPPAVCASLLASGDIDLGLIPTIAYHDRPHDCVVPGVSIASEGAVASVALFTRRPVREIRSMALDTSSRTSVALTRILCARRFEIAPTFARHAPDVGAMLAAHDAALVIGDPALFVDYRALGADKIDLGQEWTEMTGLPFVWAFWAGHADAVSPARVRRMQRTRDFGVRASDALADAYMTATPERCDVARHYLRHSIAFDLDVRMLDGVRTYFREAAALGLIDHVAEPRFFPADDSAESVSDRKILS